MAEPTDRTTDPVTAFSHPQVQFQAQPAGALVAPGGRGGCDDSAAAAGVTVARAWLPLCMWKWWVDWRRDGKGASFTTSLGQLIPVPIQVVKWAVAGTSEQRLEGQMPAHLGVGKKR